MFCQFAVQGNQECRGEPFGVAEDGTAGWGECYGPSEVYQAAINHFYAPRLLDADALQTDVLWHLMWRASLDFARGGVMMGAMSGIDMALWDLRGKVLGQSVSELMGGRHADEIPCYATGMYFKEMAEGDLIRSIVEEASSYQAQGFAAIERCLTSSRDAFKTWSKTWLSQRQTLIHQYAESARTKPRRDCRFVNCRNRQACRQRRI